MKKKKPNKPQGFKLWAFTIQQMPWEMSFTSLVAQRNPVQAQSGIFNSSLEDQLPGKVGLNPSNSKVNIFETFTRFS